MTPGGGLGTIGPYRLLSVLGQGGYGIVYEAQQVEPLRRRVALKRIRPDKDSGGMLARFRAEQQALAMMSHSGIAQIYDGGVDDGDDPCSYFVMELVRGEPITKFCDRHRLSITDRLRLFLKFCGAMQHAHERGVLHRDIKPSNVMVFFQDGAPEAKVIDFGVAKALSGSLTEHGAVTQVGQAIGTPAYMSPEQIMGDSSRIDARSDLYSMGVLLYELVTGSLPFTDEFLNRSAFELQRDLSDVYPARPSERLLQSQGLLEKCARERRTDPKSLLRTLRLDLQDIVMSAIQKNRDLRYRSAADLAADIERYLEGRALAPMPMRSRTLGYVLGKAVDRWELLRVAKIGAVLVSSVIIGICAVSMVLVTIDAVWELRLFGEYGAGGLQYWGVMGMNALSALAAAWMLFFGCKIDRASWIAITMTFGMSVFLAAWAVSVFSGICSYTAGGLIADEQFRRTFSIIYSVLYVGFSAFLALCFPAAWLVRRYGRPTPARARHWSVGGER